MHIAWTAHLANKPDEKKQFEDTVIHSKAVLDRLKQLIEEKELAIDRIEYTPSEYETAGWSHKQAHLNGRRAILTDIKNLLT